MKNKKVLYMSGWAQKPSFPQGLFEGKYDDSQILSFDYSLSSNFDNFIANFRKSNINPEVAIGWSLGGQMICRLIAKKIINPKLLILVGTPFQFVKSAAIPAAMPKKSFDQFYHNFISNPDITLKKFSLLMNIKDKNSKELANNLDINDENYENLAFWLAELEKFSCFDMDFADFPKTLIFHGRKDMVVHESQSNFFKKNIKNSELFLIDDCGHTPLLTNFDFVKNSIIKYLYIQINKNIIKKPLRH